MAHTRQRFIIDVLKKRAKLWPVVGLLGPRQVGKSTVLKTLCGENYYFNLDLKQIREEASKAPDFFIESHRSDRSIVAIDEVQKAPDLFDAVKASVDNKKRPGTFLLAGSTEFSTKVGIRESLTGRIGLVRLWPLTVAELNQRSSPSVAMPLRRFAALSTPKNIAQRVEFGGMPGLCFIRNQAERDQLIEGWLETTCYRDINQIVGFRVRGETVRDALNIVARAPDVTTTQLAQQLGISTPSIRKLLDALETLMVITRMSAHPTGIGKDRFLLCDTAVAAYLGASSRDVRQIALYQELMCQYTFAGFPAPKISYYQSSRGSFVDFVLEDKRGIAATLIVDTATPKPYVLRALGNLKKKIPRIELFAVGPFSKVSESKSGIQFIPWTHLF